MKKAIITIIALIVIASFALWQIKQSWIPDLGSYEAQKKYAGVLYSQAYETGMAGFYMPTKFASGLVLHMFTAPAFKKSLNAHLYLFKKYPQIANNDIDVLGRTGDLYESLEKFDKSLSMYQKQLEVFKRNYFKNLTYPEREGLTELQAKTEEYKYIIKIHRSIAGAYNAMKQYDKGLEKYEEIVRMLPELDMLDKWQKQAIFRDVFVSVGKLYKVAYKDYNKAIDMYKVMKDKLVDDVSRSEADIFIGDVYLAEGDVNKAIEMYQSVVNEYKPQSRGLFNFAENRLRDLREGKLIIATDGVNYEIKDNKVITRLTNSKRVVSIADVKN